MEEFRDIKGYEGLYQVSNFGNVMSLSKGDGNGNRDRLLKQEVLDNNSTTTYRRVALCVNGIVKRFSVHRLVALAFIDNPEDKPMVNHIDNNGWNNNVDNLEWCTHSENMMHAQRQGRLAETQSRAGIASGKIKTLKSETTIGNIVDVLEYYRVNGRKHARFIPSCGHGVKEDRVDAIYRNSKCAKCNEISKYKKTIIKYSEKIIKIKKELEDGKY